MKKLGWLMLLVSLSSVTIWADPTGPDPQDVQLEAALGRSIHQVLDVASPILINYVQGPLNKAAVALFVVVLFFAGLQAATQQSVINIEAIVRGFYVPYGFATFVMKNWNTPILGLGHSFTGLFTDAAQEIAAYIDVSALDMLSQKCADIQKALGSAPSILDAGFVIYWVTVGGLIGVQTIAFVVTSFAYIGLAVGVVWGLIALFFFVFPPTRWVWYGWVQTMFKYSAYFVIASIVTNIRGSWLVDGFDRYLHDDYTLEHFQALAFSVPVIMLAFIIAVFRIPHLAQDFTSGGSGAGHSIWGGTAAFLKGVFA